MITFKNGTTFETTANIGGTAQYQAAKRETLEFYIAKDSADFDALKAVYSDSEATSEITVTVGDTQSLHLDYTLPMELGLKTVDGAEVWYMKLAQKSELEIKLEAMEQTVATLEARLS